MEINPKGQAALEVTALVDELMEVGNG